MPEVSPSRYLVTAGWDDVPHLDAQTKTDMLRETLPHLRDARSKGLPSLGAGAIYPIAKEEFVVQPFRIPAWFRRGYALDVGWNRTAALFGAYDLDNDVLYLTAEHYRGQAEPPVHAAAIKARAEDWMPGFIDPAARGRNQVDGQALFDIYTALGLRLSVAINAVEAGILEVWQRLSTGRLKVFSTLTNWLSEFEFYRRDEHGRIVKEADHLMDCTRYLALAILRMIVKSVKKSAGRVLVGDAVAGY